MITLISNIKDFDKKYSLKMLKFHHHHTLNKFMISISTLGNYGIIWWIIIVFTYIKYQTRVISFHILLSLILAVLIGQITLKCIVKRKRPCHVHPEVKLLMNTPHDFSFPSGHTTASFACATIALLYSPLLGSICMLFAILTGLSRVYLFVHYISDVIAGTILGVMIAMIVYYI